MRSSPPLWDGRARYVGDKLASASSVEEMSPVAMRPQNALEETNIGKGTTRHLPLRAAGDGSGDGLRQRSRERAESKVTGR